MNLYFLVEGRRTEMQIYPAWLAHLLPLHNRVGAPDEITGNSYFLISGEGFPRLLDVALPNAVADIRDNDNYSYLVVCLDADEVTVEEQQNLVMERLNALDPPLPGFTIPRVIVQNRCIETWFLGNTAVLPRHPNNPILRSHVAYYNVRSHCPESMGANEFVNHAAFHLDYLTLMLRERYVNYSKRFPGDVGQPHYLDRLIDRYDTTGHMSSFFAFVDFCATVRQHSAGYSFH